VRDKMGKAFSTSRKAIKNVVRKSYKRRPLARNGIK
jgi:hypothetical protein